jgi:hypothetical protein
MRKHVNCCPSFLLLALLIAQPPEASAQSPLRVTTTVVPVNSLTINDLDFVNSTTPQWLFTVTLTTGEPLPIDCQMDLALTARLATGENLGTIATMRTTWFAVTGVRSVTNLDLRDPALRESDVVWDEEKRDRLRDLSLPSGRLPAGLYGLIVAARAADGRPVTCNGGGSPPCNSDIQIENPGSLELLAPNDRESMSTIFPLFQWRGDFTDWRIAVFEQLPGQSSYEEAASGVPMLDASVPAGTTSFQYPQTAGRLLRADATYVWFVEGMTGETGGSTRVLRSPLRSFTVVTGPAGLSLSMLDELERALGPRYQPVFDRIRSEGLTSTGTIRLNGTIITTGELVSILNRLRTTPDAVSTVELD